MDDLKGLKLYQLNGAIFDETRTHWEKSLSDFDDVSPAAYYHALDSAELHIGGTKQRDSYYVYALCKNQQSPAMALVDISYALPGSPNAWIKTLNIRPAPCFDVRIAEDGDMSTLWALSTLAASIITETIELSNKTYPANKIKVYAGHQEDFQLLSNAIKNLHKKFKDAYDIKGNSYKNWIEFTKL